MVEPRSTDYRKNFHQTNVFGELNVFYRINRKLWKRKTHYRKNEDIVLILIYKANSYTSDLLNHLKPSIYIRVGIPDL